MPDVSPAERVEIVHACPPDGSGPMPCCGRTPFEVPRWHRMTVLPDQVTCKRMGVAEGTDQTVEARHCPTCFCGKRAPVQGDSRSRVNKGGHPAGTIAWAEHLEAYTDYSRRYGTDQSATRIAERGGFSYGELVDQLGHEPTTWMPHV